MKLLESHSINNLVFEVYDDRPNFPFFEVNQVHGNNIVVASSEELEADGIVAQKVGDALAIKTADCLPIAFVSVNGYSMVHAGWKGLANEIVSHPLIKGIAPVKIHIGPHIKSCCFEVSEDFYAHFKNGENYRTNNNYFDLTKYAVDTLVKHYPNASITLSKVCTCCDSQYNSYRKNKTKIRNYNILKPGE